MSDEDYGSQFFMCKDKDDKRIAIHIPNTFKDHQDRLDSLEKKIEERSWLDWQEWCDTVNKNMKQIGFLEKKYKKWKRHTIQDYFKMSKVLIHIRNYTEQISELEKEQKKGWKDYSFLQGSQIKRQDYLEKQITELREKGKNHNDSIIELRSLIQSNAISDLNHYEVLKKRQDFINDIKNEQQKQINELKASMMTKTAFELNFRELKGKYEGVDANITHFIHKYHKTTEVLRELNQIVKGIAFDLNKEGNLTAFNYIHYKERLQENEKKLDAPKKIAIEPELMKRIMSHKSVPMDKSKLKTEKKECQECEFISSYFTEEPCRSCQSYKDFPIIKPSWKKKDSGGSKCDDCDRETTCFIDGDYRRACMKDGYSYYRKIEITEPVGVKEVEDFYFDHDVVKRVRGATRKELIEEFLDDITGCWTWLNGKTRTAKSGMIKEIEKKWQGRLK